jgi:hypothetical protein
MTDDLLKAATRALQRQTADEAGEGQFTRARVMASLHQGTVKRRTRLAFILPIAACFAAGTAWGAATGRLPAVFHAIGVAVGISSKPAGAPPKSAPPTPKAAAGTASLAEPVAAPAPIAEAPLHPADSARAAASASADNAARPAPSSSAAFQDADGDLYRLAHEAHFTSHDYARALLAWDAYLQAAPHGRLATEARYNRAICLVRLGRNAEARQALAPFAAGQLGYRQLEASQLLDELAR